jgi:hypothetical protein
MTLNHDLFLELSIPPEWPRIDRVREAVASSLGAVFGSGGVDEALSMVSTELLENALKYGLPGKIVRFRLQSEMQSVVVSVMRVALDRGQGGRRGARHRAHLSRRPLRGALRNSRAGHHHGDGALVRFIGRRLTWNPFVICCLIPPVI